MISKRAIQRAVRAAKRRNPTAPADILARRAVQMLQDETVYGRALAVARSWGAR